MDPLERKLRKALEHEEPPEGFAERTVARALAQASQDTRRRQLANAARRPSWWQTLSGWQLAAAWRPALTASLAALMLAAGATGYWQRQAHLRTERARAEQARDQVMLALDITRTTLQRANHAVRIQSGAEPR